MGFKSKGTLWFIYIFVKYLLLDILWVGVNDFNLRLVFWYNGCEDVLVSKG